MSIIKEVPTWVTSWHLKNDNENVVFVKEKIYEEHKDGSITYGNRLKIYTDPKRTFYITKPHARNHEFKKEFEYIEQLDTYEVVDSKLERTLKVALGIDKYQKMWLRELCNSPYVYGADIETPVFIRSWYKEQHVAAGTVPIKYTVGCLDIENEPGGEGRINVITFIHENEIYTAINKHFLHFVDPITKERTPATLDDVEQVTRKELGVYLDQYKFQLNFISCDTEVEMITWIFKKIHEKKTDFVGIWNIAHDIPYIIKRLQHFGVNPAQIMCHPSIPEKYQCVNYLKDKAKELQHITDRWDWVEVAGYSQFVDAMCLYARLRKTSGRKSSYSLDAVSNEEIKQGKLHFSPITNHIHEQKNNFVPYVAYNVNDCMLMQLMEWKNNDYIQLLALSGVSMLTDFNKQTVMGRNNTYIESKAKGRIIASSGMQMRTPFDDLLTKGGGAVLDPNKVRGIGTKAIIEAPEVETQVVMGVNDLDVAAEYPSILATFNISKETKLSTGIEILGFPTMAVEYFFGELPSPLENAVHICNQFFKLPNYQEMDQLCNEFLTFRAARDERGDKMKIDDIYNKLTYPVKSLPPIIPPAPVQGAGTIGVR